jgi:hypothetical protein
MGKLSPEVLITSLARISQLEWSGGKCRLLDTNRLLQRLEFEMMGLLISNTFLDSFQFGCYI